MMVINCSAAAATHLYGKYKKNVDEGFFEPASSVQQTIMERQSDIKNKEIIQWVVHAVKIGRSTCLIAMEYESRWVHVIHQVRKGDVQGFVERLNTRLVNGMEWLGADYSLFTTAAMEKSIDRYFKQHKEIRFYQQTDRSVMAHISQVSYQFQYTYDQVGVFPEDEEMALHFDLRLNDEWRCIKGENDILKAQEKMLLIWLVHYNKLSFVKAMRLIEQVISANRLAFDSTDNIPDTDMNILNNILNNKSIPDDINVVDINKFKNKSKKLH